MTATLPTTLSPATLHEAAARRRMHLAEGGPFLVSDRSATLALHWLVDPTLLRSTGLFTSALPSNLSIDPVDGRALLTLAIYRSTTTRVAVGDRFAPWNVHENAGTNPSWIAELRVAAEHTPQGESPESCYITLALFAADPAASWVRPDRFALRCRSANIEADLASDTLHLTLADATGRLIFSATPTHSADLTWPDIPDASTAPLDLDHATGSLSPLLLARHALDRLVMFTCERGIARRVSLWRRPQPTHTLEATSLDTSNLPASLAPLAHAEFLGAHLCEPVDGLWIGRPQCAAGPACSLAWRDL